MLQLPEQPLGAQVLCQEADGVENMLARVLSIESARVLLLYEAQTVLLLHPARK